jgi:predicted extracellular nuclease
VRPGSGRAGNRPVEQEAAMVLSVGTFNLNNLFSRFNYEAEVSELPEEDVVINSSTTFPVADPTAHRFRTYRGRLFLGKPAEERQKIAKRVLSMDADVLAVQEVEDIDTLKRLTPTISVAAMAGSR